MVKLVRTRYDSSTFSYIHTWFYYNCKKEFRTRTLGEFPSIIPDCPHCYYKEE